MDKKNHVGPFRGSLRKEIEEKPIYRMGDTRGRVVRTWKIDPAETLETIGERFKRSKDLFYSLRDKYGIAIPSMEFVIGNHNGERVVYTVVEELEGKGLAEIRELSAEDAPVFEKFFVSMFRYYADVFKNKGWYWSDFKISNLFYGNRPGESVRRVFIVDIEPRFTEFWGGIEQAMSVARMFVRVFNVLQSVEERVRSERIRFNFAREEFVNLARATFPPRVQLQYMRKVLDNYTAEALS